MRDDFFKEMEKRRKEMETLMDEVIGFSRVSVYGKTHFSPAVDIFEMNNTFCIVLDMAGISKKDISITVSDDILIIKGERKRTDLYNEGLSYYHMEIEYGPFERRIRIPRSTDIDKMKIEYNDGMLEIEIPVRDRTIREINIE